jgi:hypothetical protein
MINTTLAPWMHVLGWVLCGILALGAIGMWNECDPEDIDSHFERLSAITILAICLLVLFLPVWKGFACLAAPVVAHFDFIRFHERGEVHAAYERLEEQSRRTGVPLSDLLKKAPRRVRTAAPRDALSLLECGSLLPPLSSPQGLIASEAPESCHKTNSLPLRGVQSKIPP